MTQGTRWTLTWQERPPEEAALFNPAFCGELLARAIREYRRLAGAPLPLALSFVVLPLTLHPATRHVLPRKANTTLASWSVEQEAILAGLPQRILRLRPVTREALLFLTQLEAIAINADGLSTGKRPLRLSIKPSIRTDDVDDARRAAVLLGRWFAYQSAPATVLQTMGVQV
jgi:hypothetical protein